MVRYVQNIIIQYVHVAATHTGFEEVTPALVIMDSFIGQIMSAVTELLEENSLYMYVALLPANTTGSLQPIDLSVNKPVKDF